MNNNNKATYNPYNQNVGGIADAAIKKFSQKIQTCIPAIIKEVKGRNKVIVSPAVQQVNNDWQSVSWADITLPVYTPTGSGTFLSFPLKVGDTGWVIAGDLDPSLFLQDPTKPARQGVFDRHRYQYGFFLPSPMSALSIDSGDENGIVIKNGNTKIVIKDNEIEIKSSNTLKINANSVSITSSGNDITIDGTNFKNHNHTVPSGIAVNVGGETGATTATATTGGVN